MRSHAMKAVLAAGLGIGLGAGLALPATLAANGISYNYVDVRYGDANESGLDGLFAEASGLIDPNWFVRGGVSLLSNNGTDVDTMVGEIGYRHALQRNVDLQATGGLVYSEIDARFGPKNDDTGFQFTGGLRGLVTEQVELEATLLYRDIFNDSDLDARFGGLIHLSPEWSLGANYQMDTELITVGGRYNF